MSSKYFKSEKHLRNATKALEFAKGGIDKLRLKRRAQYYQNPIICLNCGTPLEYLKRAGKFCSHTCSAQNSNKKRIHSSKTREKISKSLKMFNENHEQRTGHRYQKGQSNNKFSKIQWLVCKICESPFYVRGWSIWDIKQTCGKRECIIHASVGCRSYLNGRKKLFKYFNKHQNKEIILESTWEYDMAVWLDDQNIKWVRPSYTKWEDETGKMRLYYPDFYLPELNLYLDPKNPTALSLSLTKMKTVAKLLPLVYGNLLHIKEKINASLAKR